MSEARHRKNQKVPLRACVWPRCDLGKDGQSQLFVPTRPWRRYCCPQHKRRHEQDIRRAGKASNMSPEMVERGERAEALLRQAEEWCERSPRLRNIYQLYIDSGERGA